MNELELRGGQIYLDGNLFKRGREIQIKKHG